MSSLLATAETSQHPVGAQRDRALAAQRPAFPRGSRGDFRQIGFGCGEQGFPLAGPLGFQERVLAGDQPLAGVVPMRDLSQVHLIGQGELERAVADQRLDLRGAQRCDPVQARGPDILAQPRGGQHAPVPDQHHLREAEPVLELAHLSGGGLGVPGVALEHLDGDRDTLLGGQQPADDLQPSADPVFGVADGAQRAGPPLERRGGHVVKQQGAAGQVPGRERVLDAALPGGQPVHRRVQVSLITAACAQHSPSELAAVSSRSPRAMASLESGAITCATAIAVTRSRCRDGAGSISSSSLSARTVPSTAATCPCGRLRAISKVPSAASGASWPFQHPRQGVDLRLGPGRQVGQGAVLHFARLAVAFRSSTVGGEPRFGTLATYMTTMLSPPSACKQHNMPIPSPILRST